MSDKNNNYGNRGEITKVLSPSECQLEFHAIFEAFPERYTALERPQVQELANGLNNGLISNTINSLSSSEIARISFQRLDGLLPYIEKMGMTEESIAFIVLIVIGSFAFGIPKGTDATSQTDNDPLMGVHKLLGLTEGNFDPEGIFSKQDSERRIALERYVYREIPERTKNKMQNSFLAIYGIRIEEQDTK